MARIALLALGLGCTLSACGLLQDYGPARGRDAGAGIDASPPPDGALPDGGGVDGAPPDVTDLDAGPAPPCLGLSDGDDCGGSSGGAAGLICVGGACVPSSCGDGVVDPGAGEECEVASDPSCDEASCRYECLGHSDCTTASPCLEGSCVAHRCEFLPTADETSCVTDAVPSGGLCREGRCVLPGCGDGVLDLGEECDRGTPVAPGCTGCQFDCLANTDCADGDPCNGEETCAARLDGPLVVARECVPSRVPFICADPPRCFAGGCVADAMGLPSCESHLLEADGDGFASGIECGTFGGDCNDSDPNIHPGAVEVCNGQDDDCDGVPDEDTAIVRWCLDADGDGFGDPTMMTESCAQPTRLHVRDCSDCFDLDDPALRDQAALVHPGQTAFFTSPYCTASGVSCSFDYDCDGSELVEASNLVDCGRLAPLLCGRGTGWNREVPACGETGTFSTCRRILLCETLDTPRTQGCR